MNARRTALVIGLVCLVALLFLPLFAEKFTVQFVTRILIMAIFAMSLNLLVGHTGMVSLGHAAFFGLAGYILALAAPEYEAANFWLSLSLAVIGAGAAALVIGFLCARTSGIYFIMATLAFAQMLYFLFHDTSLAGGSDGIYIYVRPDAALFGWRPFDLEQFGHVYFVALVSFVAVFFGLRMLLAAPFGRVLDGIRVNEQRMRSLGFATFQYKLACFVLAGMLAGLAGYLSAIQFGVVNPEMLGWHLSGSVLMMVILGGMGTAIGPVIGAAAMLLLEMALQSLPEAGGIRIGKHWQLLMGLFIVLVALFLPRGLAGLIAIRAKERADG